MGEALYKLGSRLSYPFPAAPQPPPAEYVTAAVHFENDTNVHNASLVATDGGTVSFSFWINMPTVGAFQNIWAVDPEGTGTDALAFDGSNVLDAFLVNGPHFYFNGGASISDAAWHHVLGSATTNLGIGAKIAKIFIDNVDVTTITSDVGAAFNMLYNALPFYVGDDTFNEGIVGDVADFWFAPNQSLLTDGDISSETRAKFIDQSTLKPVDLGDDGSTPTGTAPAIFLRRAPDAAASTFADNLGTGGPFTISGALTDAATSPSDPSTADFLVTPGGDSLVTPSGDNLVKAP